MLPVKVNHNVTEWIPPVELILSMKFEYQANNDNVHTFDFLRVGMLSEMKFRYKTIYTNNNNRSWVLTLSAIKNSTGIILLRIILLKILY